MNNRQGKGSSAAEGLKSSTVHGSNFHFAIWRRYIKRGFVMVLLIPFLWIAWWSARNYAGYCQEQGRFLTDAEKIDIAITDTLLSYPPTLAIYETTGGTRKLIDRRPPAEPVNYSGRDEFLRINKDCCALTREVREGQSVSLFARLTGRVSTFVTVNYLVRYRDPQGNIVSEPSGTFHAISNCGLAPFDD